MKCPKCGRENVDGAPFCADCGKSLFPAHDQEAPVAAVTEVIIEPLATSNDPAPTEPATEPDAVPTPIISDGAIYIGPVADPEPEPTPDPEPASKFQQAFNNAPGAEPEQPEGIIQEPAPEPDATPEPTLKPETEPEPAPAREAEAPAPAPPIAPAPGTAPQPPAPTGSPVISAAPATEGPAVSTAAVETAPDASEAPALAPEAAADEKAEPQPGSDPRFAPFADSPIVPPNPARAHQTWPQPGGEALYRKGCLAAAWDDIVQSKGWFAKVLLLGLVNCVPILNFFTLGYAMRWSRELFLGKVSAMPERIFGNRMFVNGFFGWVFSLVIGIVVGICGFVLDFIPFVGSIAYLALAIFVTTFQFVGILRIAIADRLGAGFDLAQVWQGCKKNFGALCCATIVPSLIIGAITMVIAFAVFLIMGLPMMGAIFDYAQTASSTHFTNAFIFEFIMATLLIMLPLFVVVYLIGCFISAFQGLLIMRATGHYVARYAQDWKSEQAVMSTAHINGV